MKVSRGAWIALAAVAAVPVTVAVAKQGDHRGWNNVSPETRTRLDEGKIAMAMAALKLTPDPEKRWAPLEDQVTSAAPKRKTKTPRKSVPTWPSVSPR